MLPRATSNVADKPWVVAMDANLNQDVGAGPDLMSEIRGVRRAVARHTKSSYPIDAVWSSHDMPASKARSDVIILLLKFFGRQRSVSQGDSSGGLSIQEQFWMSRPNTLLWSGMRSVRRKRAGSKRF